MLYKVTAHLRDGTTIDYMTGFTDEADATKFARELPPRWDEAVSANVESYVECCPCCGKPLEECDS